MTLQLTHNPRVSKLFQHGRHDENVKIEITTQLDHMLEAKDRLAVAVLLNFVNAMVEISNEGDHNFHDPKSMWLKVVSSVSSYTKAELMKQSNVVQLV